MDTASGESRALIVVTMVLIRFPIATSLTHITVARVDTRSMIIRKKV